MAHVNVQKAIQPHLDRANRKFDAAMDALVPPTPTEQAVRAAPSAYALGMLARSLNDAMNAFAAAFNAGYRR